MILKGARLILPDRIVPHADVRLARGKIAAIDSHLQPERDEEIVDLAGQFLAPGFIDMHIHGAQRCDTMDATAEAWQTICRHHAAGGTTSLALTSVTATNADILSVLTL